MRFIEDLCPPALLYLLFLAIQVGLDASLGLYVTLLVKILFGIATVIVLDMFCGVGLGIFSWFLVAAPFVITALGTAIAMGTQFDKEILDKIVTKEDFYDQKAKTNYDLPQASNAILQLE
jgi:hypothetical protein